MREAFVRAVVISCEFERSLWNTKYLDNESRGSVVTFFTIIFIRSFDKTNQLSKLKHYLYKKDAYIQSKGQNVLFNFEFKNFYESIFEILLLLEENVMKMTD